MRYFQSLPPSSKTFWTSPTMSLKISFPSSSLIQHLMKGKLLKKDMFFDKVTNSFKIKSENIICFFLSSPAVFTLAISSFRASISIEWSRWSFSVASWPSKQLLGSAYYARNKTADLLDGRRWLPFWAPWFSCFASLSLSASHSTLCNCLRRPNFYRVTQSYTGCCYFQNFPEPLVWMVRFLMDPGCARCQGSEAKT